MIISNTSVNLLEQYVYQVADAYIDQLEPQLQAQLINLFNAIPPDLVFPVSLISSAYRSDN